MRQHRGVLRQPAFLRALGAAIRSRREQLSLTIVQVADRIGSSPAAIRRLESGARNLTLQHLAAIADALEIPLPRLLARAEQAIVRSRRS